MKIKIYILILIIYSFISCLNCQCNNGFSKSDYGCNNNIGFKGFYAINCIGVVGGYQGSILIRVSEGVTPICPLAGNPPIEGYSPYSNSSINKIINNQIQVSQCYSNEKNFNIYYIGTNECLSSNDQFINNITINLNGYLYVGTCVNNLSVFKSYSNSSEFQSIRSTECSKQYSGSYEISYNSIYYGDIECPNCNGQGICSNETNYNCNCNKAYLYDPFCRVNYCDQPIYPCGQAKCNRETTECYCDSGYRLNSTTNQCIDINECIESIKYPCSTNYICVNKAGTYDCECPYNSTLNNSNEPCQLKCKNDCGGVNQGTCINGICQCKLGYTGIDCLDINLVGVNSTTRPNINSTSPSVIFKPDNQTYQSIIFIKEIIEFDIYNTIINQYNLNSIKWDYQNTTSLESVEVYNYNTTIMNEYETNIKVIIQWFKNQSTLFEFANQQLVINPYTLKFNIELSKYNFKNQLCSLQLVIGAAMTDTQASCSSYSIDQSNYDLDYFTLNVGDKSFQCRLLKRGIIDNEIRLLSNSFKYLPKENNSTFTSLSLITNLPYYSNSISLDPDLGLILKGNKDDQNLNSICNNNNNGLSNNQLIGIIIGSCVGFIIIILVSIIIFKKFHIFRSTKIGIKLREIF